MNGRGGALAEFARSRLVRALAIAFLVLLLRIPVAMIRGLIGERESRRNAAVEEVSQKWGRIQEFTGPILVVPFDVRIEEATVVLAWNAAEVAFEPGPGNGGVTGTGIHAPLVLADGGEPGRFSFELSLHGSAGMFFVPFGRETQVTLIADWPHPSFQGNWLPSEREIRSEGFDATWRIPSLGRNYPQRWASGAVPGKAIEASSFGVDLVTPVDPYRLAERSIKYDALFVGLTFLSLWLFEVLAAVRIHAIQYLLVGGAMALFYLLELSFAEHLGFGPAYAIASVGVVGLIASYAVAILGERRRGALIGVVVAVLYGYLYALLHEQDHALLLGSIGLFGILATVMWLTRRVDWYAPESELQPGASEPSSPSPAEPRADRP